jgi:hypothetical protein
MKASARIFMFGAATAAAVLLAAQQAAAAASLWGTVVDQSNRPVPGVTVVLQGQNLSLSVQSDLRGRFGFPSLGVGEYVLSVRRGTLVARAAVELGDSGVELKLALQPLRTIRSLIVGRGAAPPVRGSGTDLSLDQALLARSPSSTTFPNVLLQLPGAARGANGVVHLNGDHGDVNYIVDGVSIPQELNREIGSEFDVSNAAFVDVLEGAYPAKYGGRFAAVIDVGTRSGAGEPPGVSGYVEDGSYASSDASAEYHTPVGRSNLVVAVHAARSDRELDPPDPASPHNQGSTSNEFLRFTMPTTGSDYVNLTMSHSLQAYQLPNDTSAGEPSSTDDDEAQNDTFAALQYRIATAGGGQLSLGPSFKHSMIHEYGDSANDFLFGERLNIAAGGSPSDCANAVTTGHFGPATCAYSLSGYSAATDAAFDVEYATRQGRHGVGIGGTYDATLAPKDYSIELQPGNFLSRIYTPATPGFAYTVVDNATNVGHTESLYVQDSWRAGPSIEVDYGLRQDAFQLFSSQFRASAAQLSPRIKLTKFFGPRSSVYAYWGRFFTPFSFQNVSPVAAQELNLPLQRTLAQFDLKPQRDSDYEVGAHVAAGAGSLGIRIMQKDAADPIDDTQVGVTNLHQDINYALGRIATQTAYYQLSLPRGGRFYASMNHTYSVNKGCETQLLAPCFGSPADWTPADHEQRWGATAGMVRSDARGGWFSFSGEYGSGLSSAACPASLPSYCKYTPHTVFDVEKGVALGPRAALTVRVGNVLNDRYYVTLLNAQGNHYSTGRTVSVGVRFRTP